MANNNKFIKKVKEDNKEENAVIEEAVVEERTDLTTTKNLFSTPEVKHKEEDLVQPIVVDEVAKEKLYRILPKKDHKCCVGGKWYYFIAGKHDNVNAEMKDMLVREGILQPL